MMIHGWPGSIVEFYKAIPILIDPTNYGGVKEDTFEVICPSIPGYGFSEAPHQKGLNLLFTFRQKETLFPDLRLTFSPYNKKGNNKRKHFLSRPQSYIVFLQQKETFFSSGLHLTFFPYNN